MNAVIQADQTIDIDKLAIALAEDSLCCPPTVYGTYTEAVEAMTEKYAKRGYEKSGQYEYEDTSERVIYGKLGFKNKLGCPLDSVVSQNADGGWTEAMPEPTQRILYNEHLLKVYPDDVVYYVADEETADYLADNGKLATTALEGLHSALMTNIDCLRGRSNVVIVMGKGYADKHCYAEKIQRLLRNMAQIINLDGVDLGEGATDWFEKGYDITQLEELVEDRVTDEPCDREERIEVDISDDVPYDDIADNIFRNSTKNMFWYRDNIHIYENKRFRKLSACMFVSRVEKRFFLYKKSNLSWGESVQVPARLKPGGMARIIMQTAAAERCLPHVSEVVEHPLLVDGHDGPVILRHGYNPEQKVFVLSSEQIRAVPLEEAKQKLMQLLHAYRACVPGVAIQAPVSNLMGALQIEMNALAPHNPGETASDSNRLGVAHQMSPSYGNAQPKCELETYSQGELMEHVKAHYAEYLGCVYAIAKAWYAQRQRAGVAGQVCHCGITTLDLMAKPVCDAISLPGHHKAHTKSIQNPVLKMFHDMGQMAQRYGKLNQGMTAAELVEFAMQHGIATPGMTGCADIRSAARALGWKRRQVFGDREEVVVGGFIIRACQKPVHSDAWRSDRPAWVYEFLQLDGDQNMLDSGQVKTDVLIPHPYAHEPSKTYPDDTVATGENKLQESRTDDFMF